MGLQLIGQKLLKNTIVVLLLSAMLSGATSTVWLALDDLDLEIAWRVPGFLNGGEPLSPIQVDGTGVGITEEWTEFVVPAKLLEDNPEALVFEWCNGDTVR